MLLPCDRTMMSPWFSIWQCNALLGAFKVMYFTESTTGFWSDNSPSC